ncbi:zinc finger CCCH domain-containing protein 44-like [Rutidosis leptorrhynchoides]|uniref:zinc finger CCCH domain-containing protein 44-like n=1 Tax=Rutidosis leptorrhynchoides TaxID=125765 RepID=UPI003A9941BA
MAESQNSVAEGQISDASQPIGDCLNKVGAPVDVIETAVAGDGEVTVELGTEEVKRKRGRPSRGQVYLNPNPNPNPNPKLKARAAKREAVVPEEDEDVCFICFDGGSLVLCDHRGCPKAYHPACIKRDEAFFESAAKWECGWHICSICQKTAHHMCYTCTYSLCRGCIKKADYVCVRGDKGFCTICMKMIMLIENNGQSEDGKVQVDFDDKLSWEYLFKVYWVYTKGKLSLTPNELTEAKHSWKEASTISSVLPLSNVHNNTANDLRSVTSPISVNSSEENESKRRKIDDQVKIENETVNTEKLENDNVEGDIVVGCNNWATKELLDFVGHMKNGDTSVLSRVDVKALLKQYVIRNNLRDPEKKNQIICDSMLMSLFKRPRVGHVQMSKLLEGHLFVKEDLPKTWVKRMTAHDDDDWTGDSVVKVSKVKKRRNCTAKGDETAHAVQNKLDDFAAVNVYNMNLIYLRRDLMVQLLDDIENFHEKVIGSVVRIKILGSDLQHDMYRLVQVVGTSKVDVPYKIDNISTDVMLEVLNLDKKEIISVNAVSDKDFSEEECRRLQRSIRCGLVQHFTVGEIQEKAVALQSLKLNDWTEKETLRLTRLRDVACEKGHKKRYRECVEKLKLLKKPDELERRLQQIPLVHSDPKMNPHYESDDTEEYFNKEHGVHTGSEYSSVTIKKSRSPKRRAARLNDADSKLQKDEKPTTEIIADHPTIEDRSTEVTDEPNVEKQESGLTLEKTQQEIGCNDSTITKLDQQPTISSSVSNDTPETVTSSHSDVGWHYLDPNGKVQGPFSLVQLQRWSTTGYFPIDMRIWTSDKDNSLLLNDVLKQQFPEYYVSNETIVTPSNKTENHFEGPSVSGAIESSTVDAVNHEKLSDSQQNLSANNEMNCNPPCVESTVQICSSSTPCNMDASTSSKDAALVSLPGPTPKMVNEDEKMPSLLDSEVFVHDSGNPSSWSTASSLVVGGPTLSVKREEWVDSGIVSASSLPLQVTADHVATPTSNIDIDININSSQPTTCDEFTTWQGVSEMIEFSTLAEESVSDLLAEVDAMESQYGLPSPTSRRNSFVDDLFGSFDEFSPTPDQGTRSDGFSSSGDVQQLPCKSNTTDEHLVGSNVFDFMKMSNGLQQQSFIIPEIRGHGHSQGQTICIPQTTNTDNTGFNWPEMAQGMIDINSSAKAEGDEGEFELNANDVQVKVKMGNGTHIQPIASHVLSGEQPMQEPKTTFGAKLVNRVAQIKGTANHKRTKDTEFLQPEPIQPHPPSLTLGLDPFDPSDLESETMQGKFNHTGRHRQGRSSNSPRDKSNQLNESGHSRISRSSWNRQSSLGNNGSKGQRVCKLYESGRCKKGSSCKNLHSLA